MHESTKAELVRHAMTRGPDYIHELWDTMFNDEYDSSRRMASISIEFLNHPDRYPPALLEAARSQFPIGQFRHKWAIPNGWQERRGFAALLSRTFRRCLAQFVLVGAPDTWIVVSTPDSVDSLFPWQLTIASNTYLKGTNGERLSSRYVPVAGTIGYEVCYKAPHVISTSMERGFRPLVRAQVTFITSSGEYNILLETDALESHKAAFDGFVASIS